ncbi:MAG TPA: adventurous gliding motility protein GltC [Anaeromyxobacteraceae bacterium]|nr:adventurous gliding motility protein GltC [Anaeromyxobacteraceae bacterium]
MSRTALAGLVLSLAVALPAPASAQLGLDLTAPEPPPKKKEEPKKAPAKPAPAPEKAKPREQKPGLELTPLDLGGKSDVRPRLDAAKKLLDQKKHEEAAAALDAVLREPGLADGHDEARYLLVKALALQGLHYSALTYLDEILERGPSRTKYFHSALEWLFYVGKRLGNEQPILSRVARHARDGVPPAYQDRFHFLLAKYEFERGRALEEAGRAEEATAAWREARRLAGLVRREAGAGAAVSSTGEAPVEDAGDVYARAQFTDGLALYALKEEQAATEKFKEVVRLTNPKKGRTGDPELRELAFLQLARIHYQNKQNRYAVFYYGKMPWGGAQWLEGLWEASYAHYRVGEHEKALGNLLTLQSAYFQDEYYPESWVLKAIVYYENCRYPEARLVLSEFSRRYEAVYDELVAITSKPAAASSFLELSASPRVKKLAETDQTIKRLGETAAEIDAEVDRGLGRRDAAFRASPLGKALQERLAKEKAALVTEAGLRARGKLEYERDQLRAMLAQALRISIEVSRQEREALEGSLAAGSQVEVVKDLRWTHAVSDEHLYWPYEGEFWRDELGTYSYTLTKGCKDRPPRSSAR